MAFSDFNFSGEFLDIANRYLAREGLTSKAEPEDILTPSSGTQSELLQEIVARFAHDNYEIILEKFEEILIEYMYDLLRFNELDC
jgi:hypothetical protein